MYKLFNSNKSILDWKNVPDRVKSMKALRICITILERRTDVDNYYLSLDLETSLRNRSEDRDYKILFALMQQYWETWWD